MINGLPEGLRGLREKHGLSQREVAKRIHISPSVISGYETGEKTPSMEVLISLSYLFNCSTDYLLGRKQAERALVIDTNGLSDKQIQAIISLVDAIKSE